MALPSQSERSVGSRPVMTRTPQGGGSRGIKLAVGVLVVAGAAYALYTYWPAGGSNGSLLGPSAAKANPTTGKTSAPGMNSLTSEPPVVAKAPAPVDPPPMTLQQGSGGGLVAPPPAVRIDPNPSATPATNPSATPGAGNPAGKTPGAGAPGAQPTVAQPTGVKPSNDPTKPGPVDVTRPDLQGQPPAGAGAATPGAQPLTPSSSTNAVRALIEQGDQAATSKPVEARKLYSRALLNPEAGPTDQGELREKLTKLNEVLVFGPTVTPGDPLTEMYTIAASDSLEKIANKKRELNTHWKLIQRVNKLPDANHLRVGQKVKLVRGPFHAVVHKADFRLDLFQGSPDAPEDWVYIRSFKVGLGEGNGTPVGNFRIKKGSKLFNPPWTNPKTGEKFGADDPKNPIGEHWLGWEGLGDSAVYKGFGLHGTIDPASIGQQKSMGCVRMAPDDIGMVWEFLCEEVSLVKVVP